MESEVNANCQAVGCSGSASMHVVFGLRVFEAAGDIHISDMPYSSEHLDLCPKHISKVRHQYVHVVEYDLGDCPEHGAAAAADPS